MSDYMLLINDTYSYSEMVPVILDSNCSGNASLMLSLYMNFEVEIWLHNFAGSTKQVQTILISKEIVLLYNK